MTTKSDRSENSPEAELGSCIDRFEPKAQTIFRAVRAALRKRFASANELAYDYSHSVVISYTPTERGIDGAVAIALRDDGVFLYLTGGPQLPDPKKLLQGTAKQTRFIPMDTTKRLAHPDVAALIDAAVAHAKVPLPPKGKGKLVIQSSAKKRARRKSAK